MNCEICLTNIRSRHDTVKCVNKICTNYAHSTCIDGLKDKNNPNGWECRKCVTSRETEFSDENINLRRGGSRSENKISEDSKIENLMDKTNTPTNSMNNTTNELEVISDMEQENATGGAASVPAKELNPKKNTGEEREQDSSTPEPERNKNQSSGSTFGLLICNICNMMGHLPNNALIKCFNCELFYHDRCLKSSGKAFKMVNSMLSCINCFIQTTQAAKLPKPVLNQQYARNDNVRQDGGFGSHSEGEHNQQRYNNNNYNNTQQYQEERRTIYNDRRSSYNNPGFRTPKTGIPYQGNKQTPRNVAFNQHNRQIDRRSTLPIDFNREEEERFGVLTNHLNRERVRDLPTLTKGEGEAQWSSFYQAYLETAKFFSVVENMNRVTKSILDDKILTIGGIALRRIETFDAAMKNIDRRMSDVDSILQEYANKLANLKKPEPYNTQGCITLMDQILDFYTILIDVKSNTYWSNMEFISKIAKKLPFNIYNKFIENINKTKERREEPSYEDLAETVRGQIQNLQTRLQLDNFEQRPNFLQTPQSNQKKYINLNHQPSIKTQPEEEMADIETDMQRCFKQEAYKQFCWYHKNETHHSSKCPDLWGMDGKDALEEAKTNNICFYCGLKRHGNCAIKAGMKCNVCQRPHYAMFCSNRVGNYKKNLPKLDRVHLEYIHMLQENLEDATETTEVQDEHEFNYHTHLKVNDQNTDYVINIKNEEEDPKKYIINQSSSSILGCVTVELKDGRDITLLIDSGSTISMIEEDIADELQLYGPEYKLQVQGTGDDIRNDNSSRIIKLPIKECTIPVHVRTFKNLGMLKQKFRAKEFTDNFPHLKDMNLKDHDQVDGIIGIDNPLIFKNNIKFESSSENDPIGVRCPLGDYIMRVKFPLSKIYYDLTEGRKCYFNNLHCYSINLSENEILEYQEAEKSALNILEFESNEVDRQIYEDFISLANLKANVKKDTVSNKYQASLLWKTKDFKLPTARSLEIALRRSTIIEKVTKKAGIFLECETQVKNLLKNGYAIEQSEQERLKFTDKTYYVPIFFINPPNKRIRMIWDMAAQIEGISINDYLMTGPNLYNNIIKIMFQMREEKFLIKGDLMEMFHQIKIVEADTDALRFVFKFEGEQQVRHFKMLVLPFGAKCSPTIAHYVTKEVAKERMESSPLAADIMINSTYVDDVITSIKTKEEAVKLLLDLKDNFIKGGFELMKINSNSKEINEETKTRFSETGHNKEKQFSDAEVEKVLGYRINFVKDTIGVDLSGLGKIPETILNGTVLPTKRQILQILMSVYDPIGFFQFVVSDMKILVHKVIIYNPKMEWDETIPATFHKEFLKCLQQLKEIEKIDLPRSYYHNEYDTAELHAFGDASQEVLCGIIYVRYKDREGNTLSNNFVHAKTFVMSKNRHRTIPELELQIAVNLTDMVQFVIDNHRIKFNKINFYSDNRAVIEWIKGEAKNQTIFMNNRLVKIKQRTKATQWKWIPTELMPADLGTKHKTNLKISEENDWFHPKVFDADIEAIQEKHKVYNILKIDKSLHNGIEELYQFDKYNNYDKLVTKFQHLFRFQSWYNSLYPKSKPRQYTDEELEARWSNIRSPTFALRSVQMHILKMAQKQSLNQSYEKIIEKKTVNFPKGHELRNKMIETDEYGVIHIVTRIPINEQKNRKFNKGVSKPIWLPKQSNVTKMIIRYYHEINQHIFINSTISMLKQKYYLPSIGFVKRIIKKTCLFCKRFKPKIEQPLMGDLPYDRVAVFETTFSHSMVDMAGPYEVKVGRRLYAKRWIMVYTCLTTRAIQLEVVENLTAEATLIALQNIIDLRGVPKRITSDQGTNFKGADNLMTKVIKEWNKKNCILTPIEWYFNPAHAPHMQGAVEVMVGMTKALIKKLEQQQKINMKTISEYGLKNVLYNIANMLNNRPLCSTPMNEAGTEYLTPNHFLMMKINQQQVPHKEITKQAHLSNWKDIKEYTTYIWQKFIELYLPTLQERKKWHLRSKPLKVGDIVIVADKEMQDSWKMGRIIKIIPGSKEQVRKVEILMGKKNIKKYKDPTNKKEILRAYKDEIASIIQRPANGVAKFDV